ncbi:MAG TPA: hypothetical protein VHW73_01670 [Rudaea sp.]|jgi:hypothetical protein|nr:hypothetical protein [Rudaea sp.]
MTLKKTKHRLSIFLLTAFAWPFCAQAEMHLYWHWEGGGGGSCGAFCTDVVAAHIVIDGWRDDGTGGNASDRFPQAGHGGGGGYATGIRVYNPAAPKLQCTLTTNLPGVAGLPSGTVNWLFFIDPKLDLVNQAAFREAANAINKDQESRHRAFRLIETFSSTDGRYSVLRPAADGPTAIPPGADASTRVVAGRDGSISFAVTAVQSTTDADYANARAVHELGRSLGLADISADYDANYPSAMYTSATRDPKQGLDPCTAGQIDASVNRWAK